MTACNRVRKSWGENPPGFITALAEEVDRTNQSATARLIGISSTAVNLLLGNKYPAKLDGVERKIRTELMHETVNCPYLDKEITRRACVEYQNAPLTTANPKAFQHCRACLTCIERGQ